VHVPNDPAADTSPGAGRLARSVRRGVARPIPPRRGVASHFRGPDLIDDAALIELAGGGVKGGTVYGATDDFEYRAATGRCKVADLHATILHLLGLDHGRLAFRHHGRDERLADVYEAKPENAWICGVSTLNCGTVRKGKSRVGRYR
jgi:hypothetical protein